MDKLTGTEYYEFWARRMARGPMEAGTEEAAEATWEFAYPYLSKLRPASIIEFGCGYGRMLRRLVGTWPKAKVLGIELCQAAADATRTRFEHNRRVRIMNATGVPAGCQAQLIMTCTVLQHVTDDDALGGIVAQIDAALQPGGTLVLFENIHGTGARHMRDEGSEAYMARWPRLKWQVPRWLELHGQLHSLMIGEK